MRTWVGRGAGAFIENQLFTSRSPFVLVCSPWISPQYAARLVALAKQGVTVKVITSNKPEAPHQQSLRIFEEATKPERDWLGRVKPDWQPPNLEVRVVDERFIHAKMYAVDGYAVVGSANLTERGLFHNVEHIVIFEGPEAEQIVRDFETLYNMYRQEEITRQLGRARIPEKLKSVLKKTAAFVLLGPIGVTMVSKARRCPVCKTKVSKDAKFCPNCGAKLK